MSAAATRPTHDYRPPPDEGLAILYLDEDLIALDKPSGLLSVPGRSEAARDSLASRVQARFPDALTVHRLDMETSGVIVMARSREAHRALSIGFERRETAKRYVAVLAGVLAQQCGSVDLPLIGDWPNRPLQKVDFEQGKPSLTHYRMIDQKEDRCRVELEPVTGRSHQLRVHMLSIGHPILGDALYAPEAIRHAAPRLMLHAQVLKLRHPRSGEALELTAPPPF
ncbi:pseudouridine synthase [Niveibacterium terrae]|uniref:pseudouridine synthase n=1 Tax=Niveibacterium terrae TaxID=3373598 RepID=UPI003A8FFE82